MTVVEHLHNEQRWEEIFQNINGFSIICWIFHGFLYFYWSCIIRFRDTVFLIACLIQDVLTFEVIFKFIFELRKKWHKLISYLSAILWNKHHKLLPKAFCRIPLKGPMSIDILRFLFFQRYLRRHRRVFDRCRFMLRTWAGVCELVRVICLRLRRRLRWRSNDGEPAARVQMRLARMERVDRVDQWLQRRCWRRRPPTLLLSQTSSWKMSRRYHWATGMQLVAKPDFNIISIKKEHF